MEHYKNLDLSDIIYFCEIDKVIKTEKWFPVPEYEMYYELSDLDRVKALSKVIEKKGRSPFMSKEKILNKYTTKKGYIRYTFITKEKRKRIEFHVIKAMVFLSHTPCGYTKVVDHIDNNPHNNNIENLQVITHRLNATKDRKRNSQYTGVGWCDKSKKWRARIQINRKTICLGRFDKEIDAGDTYKKALIEVLKKSL
jgi:hypothetical protein